MDTAKQQNIYEEIDIFASKKQLAYKAKNIYIDQANFPELPRNISFPIEIDPEYNFVDGIQIFYGSAFDDNGSMDADFAIRTDYETILSDKLINNFNQLGGLQNNNSSFIFIKNDELFFPTLIKGSGKKIYIDVKNIDWSVPDTVEVRLHIVFRQVNKAENPKYVYDILKQKVSLTVNPTPQENIFKLNTSFKEIIGFSFVDKDGNSYIENISLDTDNLNIINKMPNQLYSHNGILGRKYFTPIYVNKITNIEFTLTTASTIGTSGTHNMYFLVRKPFVQPY